MGLLENVKDLRSNAKVSVTLKDGTVLTGRYLEFTQAINNDPEIASIDVQIEQEIYELYEDEIDKIEAV